MKAFFNILFFASILIGMLACAGSGDRSEKAAPEGEPQIQQDILTGSMNVVVDESVAPLMEEQLEVFRSSYTNSRINLVAQPERFAINSLLKGEAAVAVLARTLTEEESKSFQQRSVSPRVFPIAHDAIVLLRSRAQGDSTMNVSDIKRILSGEKTDRGAKLLFSSINSAPFRYLKDLVGVERVSAVGAEEVDGGADLFSEIAKNPNLIGVVSLNQFLSKRDTLDIFNNLRILGVRDDLGDEKSGNYYRPSQSSLGDDTYPLKQTIYVLNYQPNLGLGIGFSAFLTGDRGQRVVLKAGLLPATMPGREIIIRDNINY